MLIWVIIGLGIKAYILLFGVDNRVGQKIAAHSSNLNWTRCTRMVNTQGLS